MKATTDIQAQMDRIRRILWDHNMTIHGDNHGWWVVNIQSRAREVFRAHTLDEIETLIAERLDY